MSKERKYSLLMLGSLLVVLGLYLLLVDIGLLKLSMRLAMVVCITIGIIFLSGVPLVVSGFRREPEKFVGRFLILTTVQLLLAMIVMLAFVVAKIPEVRTLCFHFIVLYVVMLAIQSIGLVKAVNAAES